MGIELSGTKDTYQDRKKMLKEETCATKTEIASEKINSKTSTEKSIIKINIISSKDNVESKKKLSEKKKAHIDKLIKTRISSRKKKEFNAAHVLLINQGQLTLVKDSYSKKYTLFGGRQEFLNSRSEKKLLGIDDNTEKEPIEETASSELFEESCKTISIHANFFKTCDTYMDIRNHNGKYDRIYIVYHRNVSRKKFLEKYKELKEENADPKYLEKYIMKYFDLASIIDEFNSTGNLISKKSKLSKYTIFQLKKVFSRFKII